jgi:hypothetical protein
MTLPRPVPAPPIAPWALLALSLCAGCDLLPSSHFALVPSTLESGEALRLSRAKGARILPIESVKDGDFHLFLADKTKLPAVLSLTCIREKGRSTDPPAADPGSCTAQDPADGALVAVSLEVKADLHDTVRGIACFGACKPSADSSKYLLVEISPDAPSCK